MQDKMECDWFKPSKHLISKFATKLKSKLTNPKQIVTKIIVFSTFENKMREMHNGMHSK